MAKAEVAPPQGGASWGGLCQLSLLFLTTDNHQQLTNWQALGRGPGAGHLFGSSQQPCEAGGGIITVL